MFKQLAKGVFESRTLGIPASALAHAVGLTSISRRLSRMSGYVPNIVRFEVRLPDGTPRQAGMYSADGTDHVTRVIWKRGAYEPPMMDLYPALAQGAGAIFQVGANSGLYCILSAISEVKAHITAFEPFPPAIRWLEANIALNGLESRVSVVKAAVAGACGVGKLYVPTKDFGEVLESAASLSPTFRPTHSQILGVPVVTLDEYARVLGFEKVDLIHADVESQEHAVLQGATEILARSRPFVVLEVLQRGNVEALEAIRARSDYVSAYLTGNAVVPQDAVRCHPEFTNQVLVPTERWDEFAGRAQSVKLQVRARPESTSRAVGL